VSAEHDSALSPEVRNALTTDIRRRRAAGARTATAAAVGDDDRPDPFQHRFDREFDTGHEPENVWIHRDKADRDPMESGLGQLPRQSTVRTPGTDQNGFNAERPDSGSGNWRLESSRPSHRMF
jgi:hypothetical protein